MTNLAKRMRGGDYLLQADQLCPDIVLFSERASRKEWRICKGREHYEYYIMTNLKLRACRTYDDMMSFIGMGNADHTVGSNRPGDCMKHLANHIRSIHLWLVSPERTSNTVGSAGMVQRTKFTRPPGQKPLWGT